MKTDRLKGKLFDVGILLAIVIIFAVFKVPCLIKAVTGIPCPGCGMTRAYKALINLDLAGAFRLHAMFWSVPIAVLFYFFDWRLFKNELINRLILGGIVLGFIINWVLKLI